MATSPGLFENFTDYLDFQDSFGLEGLDAAPVSSMSPLTASYFQQYPDVAAAFQQNNYGLTADQFAQVHFNNFGKAEGRTFGAPAASPAPSTSSQTPLLTEYSTSQQAVTPFKPTAVVFGDSMSGAVGYNPSDNKPDIKYGVTVADVISKNLGIDVYNLASGGETSNEALNPIGKHGGFENYITQYQPQYAILRYGAADAIRNKDGIQNTMDSLSKMVDIAQRNGTIPIIVGVSELYSTKNSKTGSIIDYIDSGAEERANQINSFLKKLSVDRGLPFIDVRGLVEAGEGDLFDGVHANVEFGKKMADAISEAISTLNIIPSANKFSMSQAASEQKGQAAPAAPPATTEQGLATQEAISTNALAPAEPLNALENKYTEVPPSLTESIFSQMSPAELNAYSMLRESGVNELIPLTTIGGKSYFQNSDGSIIEIQQTGPVGAVQKIYNQSGDVLEEAVLPRYNARNPITDAAVAATAGLFLGPSVLGLAAPTAAAISAGAPRLNETGSLEEAAKAAGLAGLTAYGAESLLGTLSNSQYNQAFAAADAAQLANQGLDAAAIAQNLSTYVEPALATTLANTAANQAFALADATQLAQQGLNPTQIEQVLTASGTPAAVAASVAQAAAEGVTQISASDIVPNLNYQPQGGGTTSQVTGSPGSVEVLGSKLTEPASTALPSAASGLLSSVLPTTPAVTAPVTQPTQQVEVTGQTTNQATTAPAAAGSVGAVLPTAATTTPTQQVEVTGQTTNQVDADTASAVLSSVLGQPVSVVGSTQTVEVTGQAAENQIATETASALLSAITGQTVSVTAQPLGTNVEAAAPIGAATGGLLSQTVPVTGQAINQGTADAATAAGAGVGSLLSQTVPVTGQSVTQGGTDAATAAGAAAGGLLPQTVPVTGQTVTQGGTDAATAAGGIVASLPSVTSTGANTVEVTGQREQPTTVGLLPGATVPALSETLTKPLPEVPKADTAKEGSLFKPSDILNLLTLLGSAAASGGAGTGGGGVVSGLPTSDSMIGSTTPQFGSDYYNAVQRYYNAYMPETPRNVSGPLQQWYENKFGA